MIDGCNELSDLGLYNYAEKISIATHVRMREP